jgi:hypothetical protein
VNRERKIHKNENLLPALFTDVRVDAITHMQHPSRPMQNSSTRAVTEPANTTALNADAGELNVCSTSKCVRSTNGKDSVRGATIKSVRGTTNQKKSQ